MTPRDIQTVTVTMAGDKLDGAFHARLAYMIYIVRGRDMRAAHAAWDELLGAGAPDDIPFRYFVEEGEKMIEAGQKLIDALQVVAKTPRIRTYLTKKDPKALEQVRRALGEE